MQDDKEARPRHLLRWLWAALWSALFVLLWQLRDDPCSISTTTHKVVIALLIWAWLLVFFALSNRARLIQVIATILCFFLSMNIPDLYFNVSGVESATVHALGTTYTHLQDYRQSHLAEGYPRQLPEIQSKVPLEKLYLFVYTREQNRTTGVFDRFTLSAVPRNSVCGYQRSFAVTESGSFSYTSEGRPATRSDAPLDLPPSMTPSSTSQSEEPHAN